MYPYVIEVSTLEMAHRRCGTFPPGRTGQLFYFPLHIPGLSLVSAARTKPFVFHKAVSWDFIFYVGSKKHRSVAVSIKPDVIKLLLVLLI